MKNNTYIKTNHQNMIQGNRSRLMMLGGILICQSLILGNPVVSAISGAAGGALVGAGGQVITEVLTDNVVVERVFNRYNRLIQTKRKGLVTTVSQRKWDIPNAFGDIKTFEIGYSSTYRQETGVNVIKSTSAKPFQPAMYVASPEGFSPEELDFGLTKNPPLEIRDYKCDLTENDSDLVKINFGYRVQWRYQVPAKLYWQDKRRFKVILENWTSMPGKNCGEQYNGTGTWYISPPIDRNSGNGEIICSSENPNFGGTINLAPNPSSQLLFKEQVWP